LWQAKFIAAKISLSSIITAKFSTAKLWKAQFWSHHISACMEIDQDFSKQFQNNAELMQNWYVNIDLTRKKNYRTILFSNLVCKCPFY